MGTQVFVADVKKSADAGQRLVDGTDDGLLVPAAATGGGGAGGLPTPQIFIPKGIMDDPESPSANGGGPFDLTVFVPGVTADQVAQGARLWLYKYNRNRNTSRGKERKLTHPSTNVGPAPQFSNLGGGDHSDGGAGATVRVIQTEFVLALGDNHITLTIDPADWYAGPIVFPVAKVDWDEGGVYRQRGQRSGTLAGTTKTCVFTTRVVVEDPDNAGKPLYGPNSVKFTLSPHLSGTNYLCWLVRSRGA